MLEPRKLKHRKTFRPQLRPYHRAMRKNTISFGSFGLKALTSSWISARQIEAARRAITHDMKRGGKVWVRLFPDQPITLKGGEIRMGGGKGVLDHYVANVKAGTILFEADGISEDDAKEAFRLAGHKLPVRTSFIKR